MPQILVDATTGQVFNELDCEPDHAELVPYPGQRVIVTTPEQHAAFQAARAAAQAPYLGRGRYPEFPLALDEATMQVREIRPDEEG